jgi:hypothetical protein
VREHRRILPVATGGSPVLHLCSVSVLSKGQGKNRRILYRQTDMQKTQCSLFAIYGRLPKLDVAGSSPVSRSMFSITCKPRRISVCLICLDYLLAVP